MPANELRNKVITNIDVHGHEYTIHVPFRNDYLPKMEAYYFALTHSYGEEEVVVPSVIVSEDEEFTLFELKFSFNDNIADFTVYEIWDLCLFRKAEEEEEYTKVRIKSNYAPLRFNMILLEEKEKIFYPFTSRKGNVSFRINEYTLFSSFDSITVENETLKFSGNYNFAPLFHGLGYQVKSLNVIVVNNLDDTEIKLNVDEELREDLYEQYNGTEMLRHAGFKGEFHFSDYIMYGLKKYFKFYVELTYEKDGEEYTIRSTRVRVNHYANPTKNRIKKINGSKVRIKTKPTKKSKYFSLQTSDYKLVKEIYRKLRSSWVKIRRSGSLQKMYKAAFILLGKLPVRKNLVMFESFLGKQYSDSPRAIYEYMLEQNLPYDMYWSVDRRHMKYFEDKDVKYVRRFSLKWLVLMARAGYWVTNSRLPLWIPKPNHTEYVQTWHGTPLKRLAADMDEVHMPGTNTIKYKQNFLNEASKWDYLVSPNAYSTEIFRRAFQFDKNMIESGYPRNDFLINSNDDATISTIKESAGLPADKKVILYAPTWRDNQFYAKGKYRFNLELDLQQMKEELGDEYVIALRLHYLVAENLDLSGFEDFVYDLSAHEDIRELYLIADMLITDYSSVFFDYANLKRPMIFFVYDIDDYRDNLRGFYFDFEEKAPGPLVKTTDEVISAIKEIDVNGYKPSQTTETFYKRFCYLEDGQASKRAVEEVFDK
ncbi:teichoic acid poly(glycerol phosphate) polymerase [Virgibacillus siamensis]|uniref:Teichoic acid poly(Glycerol phosphate) polymerase n=1 Tax=Virgibacillus siamensis TaxID=480071 RepID=A0ABN1G6E8_9BACI